MYENRKFSNFSLPPSHPFLTTTWRAMTVAADNQRVKVNIYYLKKIVSNVSG